MERETEKLNTLEDIVHEAPAGLEFAEWLISNSAIPKREIMQCYMVWKFKYDWKEPDVGNAFERWVREGYAKRFSEIYDGRCTSRTMYERLKTGLNNS